MPPVTGAAVDALWCSFVSAGGAGARFSRGGLRPPAAADCCWRGCCDGAGRREWSTYRGCGSLGSTTSSSSSRFVSVNTGDAKPTCATVLLGASSGVPGNTPEWRFELSTGTASEPLGCIKCCCVCARVAATAAGALGAALRIGSAPPLPLTAIDIDSGRTIAVRDESSGALVGVRGSAGGRASATAGCQSDATGAVATCALLLFVELAAAAAAAERGDCTRANAVAASTLTAGTHTSDGEWWPEGVGVSSCLTRSAIGSLFDEPPEALALGAAAFGAALVVFTSAGTGNVFVEVEVGGSSADALLAIDCDCASSFRAALPLLSSAFGFGFEAVAVAEDMFNGCTNWKSLGFGGRAFGGARRLLESDAELTSTCCSADGTDVEVEAEAEVAVVADAEAAGWKRVVRVESSARAEGPCVSAALVVAPGAAGPIAQTR